MTPASEILWPLEFKYCLICATVVFAWPYVFKYFISSVLIELESPYSGYFDYGSDLSSWIGD